MVKDLRSLRGTLVKIFILIFSLSLCLSACSRYATTGEQVYLTSKNEKSIQVDTPLSEKNISHAHDLATPNKNPVISFAPPEETIKQA